MIHEHPSLHSSDAKVLSFDGSGLHIITTSQSLKLDNYSQSQSEYQWLFGLTGSSQNSKTFGLNRKKSKFKNFQSDRKNSEFKNFQSDRKKSKFKTFQSDRKLIKIPKLSDFK